MRDSYIHECHEVSPGGGCYGIGLSEGSADNLVENNISWNFDKVLVAPGSGGGNVYAYNYMDDAWIDYHPNFVESGMEASHGATPNYGLFEGNLTHSFGTDHTHGNSILMTWLRNLSTIHRSAWPPLSDYVMNMTVSPAKVGDCVPPPGYDDKCEAYIDWAGRFGAVVTFGNLFYNYVGNVIGSADTPTAPQNAGFVYDYNSNDNRVPMWSIGYGDFDGVDQGAIATLYRDGNYDIATKSVKWDNTPAQTIPDSLYLCGKPAFFGSYTWPWVDGSNATTPYLAHPYQYFPLSDTQGTFLTSGAYVTHQGYQLPAFVRFLQLRSIVAAPDCPPASITTPSVACALLVTGNTP